MSALQDIWKDSQGRLSEDKLKAYLEGSLSAEEMHEIEKILSEETMESDALEGLQQLPPEASFASVHKLNQQLHHLTAKRKRRAIPFNENKWAWMAIAVILILCALAFWVLYTASK